MGSDPGEPQLSFHDLPAGVLDTIISNLSPADLAALATQGRRFKDLVDASSVWEAQCRARWAPFCGDPKTGNTVEGLDWQSLYRKNCLASTHYAATIQRSPGPGALNEHNAYTHSSAARTRAVLAPSVVAAVDLALAYQACSKSGAPIVPGTRSDLRRAFEQSMKAAFEVGMECQRKPESRDNPLVKQLQTALCWWLSEKQEVAVAFVRDAKRSLEEYDMWRMAFINWPDIPWRRSAVDFLPGLIKKCTKAWDHVSVLSAIEAETKRLDVAIDSLRDEGDSLAMRMPEGLPESHWWFRLN